MAETMIKKQIIIKELEKQMEKEICQCGHHTKDHSYEPDKDDLNLYCDKCDCQNFLAGK